VPWVVQVDRLGQAQAIAPAVADYTPSDPQIAFYLARFVEQVRSLPADPIIVRQNWSHAYDFTTSAGAIALNEYARANDPFTKVGRQQIAVDVSSVIRASPTSFRVAWTERRYQDGASADTARWTAILTVLVQTPSDADTSRKNPLGIYISYDNAAPAVLATDPPAPVTVVESPKPSPLPGQLKPIEKSKSPPEPTDPTVRVNQANAAARVQPVRDGFINAMQVYHFTDGALYQVYCAVGEITDIALQPGEQLV
ncbi:hypothetical protein OY671_008174, partial [Metschnikowia pulcherrima]